MTWKQKGHKTVKFSANIGTLLVNGQPVAKSTSVTFKPGDTVTYDPKNNEEKINFKAFGFVEIETPKTKKDKTDDKEDSWAKN